MADAPRPRVAEEMAARASEEGDPHLRSAAAVAGYAIHATDGSLGHVEDFLIDEETWGIRYFIVDPRNWWPGAHVILSTEWIRDISWSESAVKVELTKDAVRNAPPYCGVRGGTPPPLRAHAVLGPAARGVAALSRPLAGSDCVVVTRRWATAPDPDLPCGGGSAFRRHHAVSA